jgi:SAM-dependent methyltransferase
MLDFNQARNSYRNEINKSLSFTGADHSFFVIEKGKLIRELIADRWAPETKVKILDVGCGHGFVHPELVAAGHAVTGVEVADQVLALARAENPTVDYRAYDGNVLPFVTGSFDVAIAMCVVHHVPVPRWGAFVEEMRRVVRPGGLIAIFEHNPLNPVTRYLFAYGFDGMDKGATMVRRRRLEDLLRAAGCPSVRSSYIFFTPFGSRFFRWMDRRLGWLPFGAQYFTLAER